MCEQCGQKYNAPCDCVGAATACKCDTCGDVIADGDKHAINNGKRLCMDCIIEIGTADPVDLLEALGIELPVSLEEVAGE